MQIFEKIKIKLKDGESKIIKICGIPILQYDKIKPGNNVNTRYYYPKRPVSRINKGKLFFYLKVHYGDYATFLCLQNWINIVSAIGGDYFIICDNDQLKSKILTKIIFPNSDIKFIKSQRRELKNVITNLTTDFWKNPGYAHATTFYHAKEHGIEEFWNIDADDTLFLTDSIKTAEILKKVRDYAKRHDIELFSLDMWRSRTRNKAWTFGITYTQKPTKFVAIANKESGAWKKEYSGCDNGLNIDWYVTYLKNTNKMRAETYYVENCSFIHFGRRRDFLTNIMGSYLCNWQNGKLTFPIISQIYKNKEVGIIPISAECIKFDLGLKLEDCLQFQKNILIPKYPNILKNLWNVNKF